MSASTEKGDRDRAPRNESMLGRLNIVDWDWRLCAPSFQPQAVRYGQPIGLAGLRLVRISAAIREPGGLERSSQSNSPWSNLRSSLRPSLRPSIRPGVLRIRLSREPVPGSELPAAPGWLDSNWLPYSLQTGFSFDSAAATLSLVSKTKERRIQCSKQSSTQP